MAGPDRRLRAVPTMHPVDSSAVAAVGYDPRTQDLFVRFVGPGLYAYAGVEEATYTALRAAESVGAFVNEVIKPHHPVTRCG